MRRLSRARRAGCCLLLSIGLTEAGRVEAAGPLGRDGDPIATSSYAIDLFQGPVLASARTTGLAGAYAALAEGVDGNRANAAAPGVRDPWSRRWVDPSLALGFTLPGGLSRTDFDNDGRVGFAYEDFYFLTAGANVALGSWGLGFSIDGQHYALSGVGAPGEDARSLNLVLQRGHLLGSHAFLHGEFVVGAGMQLASLEFAADAPADQSREQVFAMASSGVEAGVLWAPTALPLRLALSGRTPSESKPGTENGITPDAAGDTRVGPFCVPERLDFPWEVEIGWAVQVGKRKLNARWQNPREVTGPLWEELDRTRAGRMDAGANAASVQAEDRARVRTARRAFLAERRAAYAALPRQKLLVSASLLLSGPVEDGVGFESFLRQTVQRSGEQATLTPRLGVEVEPIANHLQTRGGTYLEPSRFEQGRPRLHGTAGFDVRLLRFGVFGLSHRDTYWRAGAHLDAARQYLAWGLSLGVWH